MNLFLICFIVWFLIGIVNISDMVSIIIEKDNKNEKYKNKIESYLLSYSAIWILLLLEYANRLGWIS